MKPFRRVLIALVGGTVLLAGMAMIVLPGPALIVIPLGIAILATEFAWARLWLKRGREYMKWRFSGRSRLTESASVSSLSPSTHKISPRSISLPLKLVTGIGARLAINPSALTSLLIQCLTGVRSEELSQGDPGKDRLRWRDISLNEPNPTIHLRSDVSNTGKERFLPIPAKLVQWLRIFRLPGDEPIFVGFNLFRKYRQILRTSASLSGQSWTLNLPAFRSSPASTPALSTFPLNLKSTD